MIQECYFNVSNFGVDIFKRIQTTHYFIQNLVGRTIEHKYL